MAQKNLANKDDGLTVVVAPGKIELGRLLDELKSNRDTADWALRWIFRFFLVACVTLCVLGLELAHALAGAALAGGLLTTVGLAVGRIKKAFGK